MSLNIIFVQLLLLSALISSCAFTKLTHYHPVSQKLKGATISLPVENGDRSYHHKYHSTYWKLSIICAHYLILSPTPAQASAREALQLLHGYQTRTPDIVVWIVLISGALYFQFEFMKFLSRF